MSEAALRTAAQSALLYLHEHRIALLIALPIDREHIREVEAVIDALATALILGSQR